MQLQHQGADGAVIEFDVFELIGLYKLSMAHVDPVDPFFGDEDVELVTARLQVQLAGIVGP